MQDSVLTRQLKYKWAPFSRTAYIEKYGVVPIVKAKGVHVYDLNGKEYIDCHAGLWLVNVGYGRESIIEAVNAQMKQLAWFSSFEGYTTLPSIDLAERMIRLLAPEGMGKVFFSNSGSEAVETALKVARQYWKLQNKAGKYKFISRNRAYHGVNFGGMSATGMPLNREMFEPLLPGFSFAPAPDCFRCDLDLKPETCGIACATRIEEMILGAGPDTVAAVIAEPVQGAGGVVIPPEGYLRKVAEICRKYDVLLILDEVITGFGRTGSWFGARRWGVQPDIMTFAKGITSGYVPLGATAVTDQIYDTFRHQEAKAGPFRHGNTYSGHPVACAAALANLDIIEEEDLPNNAAHVGGHLFEQLKKLAHCRVVDHVSSVGLIGRIQIVEDKTTHRSFPPSAAVGEQVSRRLRELGFIARVVANDILTISPPLCLTMAESDQIAEGIEQVITELDEGVLLD